MSTKLRIILCLKQIKTSPRIRADGSQASAAFTFNPDDETALEAAFTLRDQHAVHITALTMGPPSAETVLREALARGCDDAVLITSSVLAGSDTLATARTLADAVRTLSPDLIICGRRASDGDTGQVPAMLAGILGVPFIPDLLKFDLSDSTPAVVTFARAEPLRRPSIMGLRRARSTAVRIIAPDTGYPSPTRVVRSTVLAREVRRPRILTPADALTLLMKPVGADETPEVQPAQICEEAVCMVVDAPIPLAFTLGYPVEPVSLPALPVRESALFLAERIRRDAPAVVLAPATSRCRAVLPYTAALLGCGMTADCTGLRMEQGELVQIRPAFGGDVLAEIVTSTRPVVATVRVPDAARKVLTGGAGLGSRGMFERLIRIADRLGMECCATRAAVDLGYADYARQLGQSGRIVTPALYAGIGVSGAPQHLAGIHGGTRLSVNIDRTAPILDVSDYAVLMRAEDVLAEWEELLGL